MVFKVNIWHIVDMKTCMNLQKELIEFNEVAVGRRILVLTCEVPSWPSMLL